MTPTPADMLAALALAHTAPGYWGHFGPEDGLVPWTPPEDRPVRPPNPRRPGATGGTGTALYDPVDGCFHTDYYLAMFATTGDTPFGKLPRLTRAPATTGAHNYWGRPRYAPDPGGWLQGRLPQADRFIDITDPDEDTAA